MEEICMPHLLLRKLSFQNGNKYQKRPILRPVFLQLVLLGSAKQFETLTVLLEQLQK